MVISLGSPSSATTSGIHLWPQEFSLENYRKVFQNRFVWSGYRNTILRTLGGTATQLLCTALAGYALSKRFFPHRSFWTFFIVFTMFFSGGMISSYMLVRSLGLFDTYSVMILPGLVGAYNLVLMRNYFMSLPEEIEESYAGVDRYQRCDRFQQRRQGGDHLCIHPAHPMRLPIYPKILRQRRYGRFLEGMIYSVSNADYKEGGFP